MSVDLPAPFSPMSACTSPGSSLNVTPSSALTPGKLMLISRISTTEAGGSVVDVVAMGGLAFRWWTWAPPRGLWGEGAARRRRQGSSRGLSVLAIRQRLHGLLLVECLVGHDYPRRHGVTGHYLLGQVHQLRTEQGIAFDEEVEFAVGQGLHAVVGGVDRDDFDVLSGFEPGRLDGLDRT